jgi:anti-anti-sigma factor
VPLHQTMNATVNTEKNATIFALQGRLDSNSAPQFERQLTDYLNTPAGHLVFDCHDLDYISSAGLRVILNIAKAYSACPFRFVACALQDHVLEVFEISGFDSFITIKGSVDECLTQLTTP